MGGASAPDGVEVAILQPDPLCTPTAQEEVRPANPGLGEQGSSKLGGVAVGSHMSRSAAGEKKQTQSIREGGISFGRYKNLLVDHTLLLLLHTKSC